MVTSNSDNASLSPAVHNIQKLADGQDMTLLEYMLETGDDDIKDIIRRMIKTVKTEVN